MQRDLTVGAPVGGLECLEVTLSYKALQDRFAMVVWLSTVNELGRTYLREVKRCTPDGEAWAFWMLLDGAQPMAAHFKYVLSLDGREGFALAEVRPARDPALQTPEKLWLPSAPRWEEI